MIDSQAQVAQQLRRCIETLMSREQSTEALDRTELLLTDALKTLSGGVPRPLPKRIGRFMEQMGRQTIEDGSTFEPFTESPVSGSRNPLSPLMIEVRRREHTVVAEVRIGTAFEGAPGRAHGGFIAALFDDVMGALQLVIGKSGYTRSLHIDYLAAFPIDETVTVTAHEVDAEPGRFAVQTDARAGDRVVATAIGVFTEIERDRFARP